MANDPLKWSITREELLEAFDYNADSGKLFWKVARSPQTRVGQEAGYWQSTGYREVSIRNCKLFVHRVAWMMIHGRWPVGQLDHTDGNKANNALSNLREVTDSQSSINRKIKAGITTPYRGVAVHGGPCTYSAHITCDGKNFSLGKFDTFGEAMYARAMAERSKHGKYRRVGT